MWERGLKLYILNNTFTKLLVAPRVGAWIETHSAYAMHEEDTSLPVWERGLKLTFTHNDEHLPLSLPVWERGLKPRFLNTLNMQCRVAPRVGAWIETWIDRLGVKNLASLPVWERGLKHTE